MRMLKMPNAPTAPQALWRQLLRDPRAATVTADLIRALNSHVNFDHDVPAGAVLLIPDTADVNANAGTSVGSGQVDDFLADVEAALKATAARITTGLKEAEADRASIAAALKSAPAKRLVDSDPQVGASLQTAAAQFKADQERAKEIQSQLAALQKRAPAELERLRTILAG
jgi:uncharacterized phage infection (PIP) family protein YhgE